MSGNLTAGAFLNISVLREIINHKKEGFRTISSTNSSIRRAYSSSEKGKLGAKSCSEEYSFHISFILVALNPAKLRYRGLTLNLLRFLCR